MKTKVISVRLESFIRVSDKAYKATAFDGSSDFIPASQYFGPDYDAQKSDAYWISAWILEKKELQYSNKKIAWFNQDTNKIEPNIKIVVEKHVPELINATNIEADANLVR